MQTISLGLGAAVFRIDTGGTGRGKHGLGIGSFHIVGFCLLPASFSFLLSLSVLFWLFIVILVGFQEAAVINCMHLACCVFLEVPLTLISVTVVFICQLCLVFPHHAGKIGSKTIEIWGFNFHRALIYPCSYMGNFSLCANRQSFWSHFSRVFSSVREPASYRGFNSKFLPHMDSSFITCPL